MMLFAMLFHPKMLGCVAESHVRALFTPFDFSSLDRMPPKKRPIVAPAADDEDVMAVHKSLKPAA